MKKNRIDSFTCFVGFLLILALFFSIKLFAGIQDGKKQYSALVSLGDLTYDDDFLKNKTLIFCGNTLCKQLYEKRFAKEFKKVYSFQSSGRTICRNFFHSGKDIS